VTTNRDLLVGILREDEFLAGQTDTGYLTRHDPAELGRVDGGGTRQAAAAALAYQALNRQSAKVLTGLPSGWRNSDTAPRRTAFTNGEDTLEVAYAFRRDGLLLEVNGASLGQEVRVVSATPESVELEIDGVRRAYRVNSVDGVSYVDGADGSAALVEVPRFADPDAVLHAGSLLAPMPGAVLRVLAEEGDTVTAGKALVVLEAMKMEHTVAAPVDGVVSEMRVSPGDQVETGQVLAVVDDGSEDSESDSGESA
jgi:acetyl/propionyl-CoA carboxylase alpha subunit